MPTQPLVSIVTPSFNSGAYIKRTIESVLSQDYPHIEYIVMDGASTDGTQAILERYTGRLQYVSAPDKGVVDAINKGLARSKGRIVAWLSADDEYLPGAVSTAVRRFSEHPDAALLYGEGVWVDAAGREIGPYPTVSPYRRQTLEQECGICQPAAFLRAEALESVGRLNPALHFAFDYDLWIRLSKKYPFVAVPERFAVSRMHRENKTLGKRRQIFLENIAVLRRHYAYVPVNWVYGYLSYLRDGRDQFFEPLRHSAAMYLAALAVGSAYNYRHLWRYWREWASRLKPAKLATAWKRRV
jgi:glycosyltransferase involved in cell wall biosynthesis